MTDWLPQTLPIAANWTYLAFGNGVFVAGVYNSSFTNISTSVAGSTWTTPTKPWATGWTVAGLCFGSGLFVVNVSLSGSYQLWSSPDGVTWTRRASAQTVRPWLIFANGRFINMSGTLGSNVMTSLDGITWNGGSTSITDGSTYSIGAIFGSSIGAVATNATTTRMLFSTDGTSWTPVLTITGSSVAKIAYGNGLLLALMGTTTIDMKSSTDGLTWTSVSSFPIYNLSGGVTMGFGNGLFVVPNTTTTALMFSDLTAFPSIPIPQHDYGPIAYGNDQFVMASSIGNTGAAVTYSNPQPRIATMSGSSSAAFVGATIPPTIYWVQQTNPLSVHFLAFGNGIFVGTSTGGICATSTDGATWTTPAQAGFTSVSSIVFGNGMFVINTVSDTQIWSSPDGVTWTQRATSQAASIHAMHFANGIFMATNGVTGNSLTSTDAITWTTRSTTGVPTIHNPSAFCSGPSGLLGISGTDGYAYFTSDGFTWTYKSIAPVSPTNSGVYGNGVFTAVYQNPSTLHTTIIRSPDGVTWTSVTPTTNLQYSPVVLCFGNGQFVGPDDSDRYGLLFSGIDFASPIAKTLPYPNNFTMYAAAYGNDQFVLAIGVIGVTYYSPPPKYTIIAGSSTAFIGTALTPGTMIDTSPTATTSFIGEARNYRDIALVGGSSISLIGACFAAATSSITGSSTISLIARAFASGTMTGAGDSTLTATGKAFVAGLTNLPGVSITSLIGTANHNVLATLSGTSATNLPAKSTAATLLSAPGGSTISLIGKSTATTQWGSSGLSVVSLIGVGMGIGMVTIAGTSATNLSTRVIAVTSGTWVSTSATNLLGKSTASTTSLITASSRLTGIANATAASLATLPGSSTLTPVSGALASMAAQLSRPVSHLVSAFLPIPRTATLRAALPSTLAAHGTASYTPVPLFASVSPLLAAPQAALAGSYSPAPLSLTAHPTLRRPAASGKLNIVSAINCYVWGAQIEAGPAMTSYIPTAGSTASRAADFLQVASVESPLAITLNALILCGLAQAILGYTPRTSNEATDILNQYITLFDATIAPASNLHWVKTVSSLTELRTQVLSYLQQQIAVEPTVLTQTFGDSLPDVVAAYAVYGDANRAKELVSANDPVNPLYMPASFDFINA